MDTPSQCCIQKLTSFCRCRQVSQILMNPIDLEESIIQVLLATGDGTKKVLPLNTGFKVKHFQTTLPTYFYVRNQSIQWCLTKVLWQWLSKQHQNSSSTLQRDITQKKSPFNKMHAQMPSCSRTGSCSTHSVNWKTGSLSPGTDYQGSYANRWTATELIISLRKSNIVSQNG